MAIKALRHVSRRKYIQQSLKMYKNPRIDVRRLRRVLGYAYDDMCKGTLGLI